MAAKFAEHGEACERFFSIDELVGIFLHNTPTLVLVNCQRVCTLWRSIIEESPALQQRLFLEPEGPPSMTPESDAADLREHGSAILSTGSSHNRIINPLLGRFAPILGDVNTGFGDWCSYEHIRASRWARDGMNLEAPAREAFARYEASWRNMLVSQPPITRLDWWHEWQTADNKWGSWGHQNLGGEGNHDPPVTIGMLWDLVETRLRRGCEAKILYFPGGQDPTIDPSATKREKDWAADGFSQHRGFTSTLPRVKLMTRQTWEQFPRSHEHFNMETHQWEARKARRGRSHRGDGFNALRQDVHSDSKPRWSQSEAYQWLEINGESSGGPDRLLDPEAYADIDEDDEEEEEEEEQDEAQEEESDDGDQEPESDSAEASESDGDKQTIDEV